MDYYPGRNITDQKRIPINYRLNDPEPAYPYYQNPPEAIERNLKIFHTYINDLKDYKQSKYIQYIPESQVNTIQIKQTVEGWIAFVNGSEALTANLVIIFSCF
jgi:hypothetical protein